MRSKINVLIFILMAIVIGCVPEHEDNIALKISTMFAAKTYNLEQVKTEDMVGGEVNLTILTLNFSSPDFNYKKQTITSASALVLFKEYDQSKFNENDTIKVIIKTPKIEYSKAYNVKDLKVADTIIGRMVEFINSFQRMDSLYIKKSTDSLKISDSDIQETANFFSSLNHTYGKVTNITTTGFNYNHSMDTGEPILVLWMEINNNKKLSFCTIYVSMITRKIIYYSIGSDGKS